MAVIGAVAKSVLKKGAGKYRWLFVVLSLVTSFPLVFGGGALLLVGVAVGVSVQHQDRPNASVTGWVSPIANSPGWSTYMVAGGSHAKGAIDFPVAEGTEVFAIHAGTVVTADSVGSGPYGKYVLLSHPDTNEGSLYAHFSQVAVQSGAWVETGQVLGLSGNTGQSTGPHLHFEGRSGGVLREHIVPSAFFLHAHGVDVGECFEGPCQLGLTPFDTSYLQMGPSPTFFGAAGMVSGRSRLQIGLFSFPPATVVSLGCSCPGCVRQRGGYLEKRV